MVQFPEVHRDAALTIDFQRTLRIPDDGQDYPLPPGLGDWGNSLGQVEGLPEQVVGRLYDVELLSTPGELKAAGTLSTGDLGPYRRVHLSGRILGTVFQGVF